MLICLNKFDTFKIWKYELMIAKFNWAIQNTSYSIMWNYRNWIGIYHFGTLGETFRRPEPFVNNILPVWNSRMDSPRSGSSINPIHVIVVTMAKNWWIKIINITVTIFLIPSGLILVQNDMMINSHWMCTHSNSLSQVNILN